jgi:hypothetical protein
MYHPKQLIKRVTVMEISDFHSVHTQGKIFQEEICKNSPTPRDHIHTVLTCQQKIF